MKKKLVIFTFLLLLITKVNAQELGNEYESLNNELSKLESTYQVTSLETLEEEIKNEIDNIISDEIEKEFICVEQKCTLVLKKNEITSEEKIIYGIILENVTDEIESSKEPETNEQVEEEEQEKEPEDSEEQEEEQDKPNIEEPETDEEETQTSKPLISYQTHIQDIGWQDEVQDGEISGTEHQSKRLEAIIIRLTDEVEGTIKYSSHIQDIGWQDEVEDGEISGTEHQSKRLEAIKISLTDELERLYDIYYRVHIEDFGWLGWAKNGEMSGSQGLSKRLEAIEIQLLEKESGIIKIGEKCFIIKDTKVNYQVHGQNYGDQQVVSEGKIAGTTGKSLRLEAILITTDTNLLGSLIYQSYIEKEGWQDEVVEGELSGTKGKSKAIQFVKINLTEELAEEYNVYYRLHSANYGWLGWAKNGEIAGVNHYSAEAIQIVLYLKKDSNQYKLSTNNHYIEKVSYTPMYYNQKDSRWSNIYYGSKKFGNTGCAPTSMAMAFQGILNKTILPTDVADYLYYQTDEYNKHNVGSSGQAIVKASDYFGIKRTALKTKQELEKALQEGKIVFAAMGNGKYGKPQYNHAIIIFGYYCNNTTNTYDPLLMYNNTRVDIELLWREQSIDPDDYSGGSNFHSLERF